MNREFDTFGLVLRMRSMVYSSKDFESLWFLYQAEGLPKNISIEEFCTKHGVDFSTFDKWYRKTHKKVYPITVTGMLLKKRLRFRLRRKRLQRRVRCTIQSGNRSNTPLIGCLTSTRISPSASSALTEGESRRQGSVSLGSII